MTFSARSDTQIGYDTVYLIIDLIIDIEFSAHLVTVLRFKTEETVPFKPIKPRNTSRSETCLDVNIGALRPG